MQLAFDFCVVINCLKINLFTRDDASVSVFVSFNIQLTHVAPMRSGS